MKKVLSVILCAVVAVSCLSFSASAKKVTVKAPKLNSVTQTDLTTAKIKWSKVSGAKGYVLYYSTTGRSYKKLTTTTKKSYNHKKLKNDKKYYYKVKAFKKVSGKKKYSKYSNVIAKKCNNYLVNFLSPYRSINYNVYKSGNYMKISGTNYTNGFSIGEGSVRETEYCIFNLGGKYKYISFTYGTIDGNDDYEIIDNTIQIYSDDECIKSLSVGKDDLAKTVKIDIQAASKLEFRKIELPGRIGFGNVKLYK